MRKKRQHMTRSERRELRDMVQRALHQSDGTIPPGVLTTLVRDGLLVLGTPEQSDTTVAVTGLPGKSVHAALRWPYRATLNKLRNSQPVTLDELAELNLMTVAEAADLMGVSDRTVHALIAEDEIPHFRIHARAIRVPAGAVVEHLTNRLTHPTARPADALTRAPADLETRTTA
jgi:excisionase family DNA binding protein